MDPTNTPEPDPTTAPEVVSTSKGDFVIPGSAFLDGLFPATDSQSTLMMIDIWDSVPRLSRVCELEYGTEVKLLAAQWYGMVGCCADDARFFLQVQSGPCKGWVAEEYLSLEYQEPVGERFP